MKYHIDSVVMAEQSLLGALMQEPEKLIEVKATVDPEDFYDERNKDIYSAILRLDEMEIIPDTTTIFEEINNSGAFRTVDASLYIVDLYDITPSSRNIMHYANLVKRYSIYREIRAALLSSTEEMNQGNADIDSLTATLFDQVERAMERAKTSQFKNMKDVTDEVFKEILARMAGEGQNVAVPTGYGALDKLVGFGKGDLIILAARPAMGKTAFTLNIAQNVTMLYDKTVAFFSLEMGKEQLVGRILSSVAGVSSEKLRRANMDPADWEKVIAAADRMSKSKLFIDDTPGLTVQDMRSKLRRLKVEHGLDLVIVDYTQLMQGRNAGKGSENRQQEVSEISRNLKLIAREFNVPVIALSQLSRSVESRPDKRPVLSDLRESGSLEQDADIVIFLYRDKYYDENSEKGDNAEVLIRKHRNGSVGTVELQFVGELTQFRDVEFRDLGPEQ